jgi:hypothetical protein
MRRVPVRPGKNTASTIEVAARNELLRQAGHHSARAFHARLAAAMPGVHDPTAILGGRAERWSGRGPAHRGGDGPLRGGALTALRVLEDLSFDCIDNLPTPLIEQAVALWAPPARCPAWASGWTCGCGRCSRAPGR